MNEIRGWLLDLYEHSQQGTVLWLLGEDGQRHCLRHLLPVAFYASGPFERLRLAWRWLESQPFALCLDRTQRQDLFAGLITVLAVQLTDAAVLPHLFRQMVACFPDLDYYDVDLPLALRYAAAYDLFPLARCRALVDQQGWLQEIRALDSRWDLDPTPAPLRILTIHPDVDPVHAPPAQLELRSGRASYRLSLANPRSLLVCLNAALKAHDPDLILTQRGDTWLFPLLFELAERVAVPFNPNRDPQRQALQRKERSIYTYGQVLYRGQQVHLFGRWHVDELNAMMYGDYGLDGALEQARVTGLPLQEIARKSPGSGITAMQMQTALRRGVLIPYQKQQAEYFKSAADLISADFGGLVYQPLVGLHDHVAEIDFISMYPSIMARFNISPETVAPLDTFSGYASTALSMPVSWQSEHQSKDEPGQNWGEAGAIGPQRVPELGIAVDQGRPGLVPETLQPLLDRRLALKQRLAGLDPRDCRVRSDKARAAALKWLLVVCFGYLGYKNARFGRIESHQAVTAYSREILLQAKETAEAMGYVVLHLYVDGLWVRQPGHSAPADFQPLLEAIAARTHLPIALEGVYRWVAFLPSRLNERLPVANRYFGVFQDGSLKMRGIEARRRDTPAWIAGVQVEILQRLSRAPDASQLPDQLPGILNLLRQQIDRLRAGQVPLETLLVGQGLSRALAEYRSPSPAARAAAQLEAAGKSLRPGQRVRFLYTRGQPGVRAWDLSEAPDPASLDTVRYCRLLIRAAGAILAPLSMPEQVLQGWLESRVDLARLTPEQLLRSSQPALALPPRRAKRRLAAVLSTALSPERAGLDQL